MQRDALWSMYAHTAGHDCHHAVHVTCASEQCLPAGCSCRHSIRHPIPWVPFSLRMKSGLTAMPGMHSQLVRPAATPSSPHLPMRPRLPLHTQLDRLCQASPQHPDQQYPQQAFPQLPAQQLRRLLCPSRHLRTRSCRMRMGGSGAWSAASRNATCRWAHSSCACCSTAAFVLLWYHAVWWCVMIHSALQLLLLQPHLICVELKTVWEERL